VAAGGAEVARDAMGDSGAARVTAGVGVTAPGAVGDD
jgi:hypothetical protein